MKQRSEGKSWQFNKQYPNDSDVSNQISCVRKNGRGGAGRFLHHHHRIETGPGAIRSFDFGTVAYYEIILSLNFKF
jgi:hypothetical protein